MSTKKQTQETLVSMGFEPNYVKRAFKVFEKNYGYSYDIKVITEIIVRLQNKDKLKLNQTPKSKSINKKTNKNHHISFENNNNIPFQPHMTMEDALKLNINDKIDHRDQVGRFSYATIKEKQGTNLKIHYEGWSRKWDTWSDFSVELCRFAEARSISKRPAHRFKQLKKGDCIDINPTHRHPGWKGGEVKRLDQNSGQIQVVYESLILHKGYLYWTHLDNTQEIAPFASKVYSDIHRQKEEKEEKEEKKDLEKSEIKYESETIQNIRKQAETLNWKLSEIFTNDAIYSCFAKEIYGDLSKVNQVKQECKEYMNNDRIYFGYLLSINSILIALSELYNVRIRIFGYDYQQKKLCIQNDVNGENEETINSTVNLALILLMKCSNNREEYGIIEDPLSAHKRPLNVYKNKYISEVSLREIRLRNNNHNIYKHNKNTTNSKKRKLSDDYLGDNQPPSKKRKLSHNNNNNNSNSNSNNRDTDDILNENKMFKKKIEILQKRLDLFEVKSNKINAMNLDELNDIKNTLKNIFQSKIKLIEEAEKELIDNKYKCVACMDKAKNISFMDGCSHMALCDECEASLQIKKCPICQKPYKNAKKINF